MDWLTPALAFVGGAVGAAASYLGAQRGTRQRESQGRREEWGRRFTAALEDIASDSFRRRELGRVVLVQLTRSHLATTEERDLARTVLEAGVRLEPDGAEIPPSRELSAVDDVEFVEDDEGDETEGGRPWPSR